MRLISVRERGVEAARVPVRTAPDFATLYDLWFEQVARWLKALGAPEADHEDLAQEVFLVVRRRLPEFDGQNAAGWLFQIARRQVLRYRRLRWVQRVLTFGNCDGFDQVPQLGSSPLSVLETKERRALVEHLLSKLSDKRRIVFALFELEGHTGEEIAELLEVPLNTVWTRLHHARKDFYEQLARFRRTEQGQRWSD
jgi:RNA polymerase sigma-70 factor (ECF subfamily)